MRRRAKLLLARLGARVAAELVSTKQGRSAVVPVLCYHRVLPELVEDPEEPLYTLLPEQFEAQLALLAREGWQTLTLAEFARAARGECPLPPKAVLLTFDDGSADNYFVAWPLAQKYGLCLNLFLTTGFLGKGGLLFMDRQGYRLSPGGIPGEVPAAWRAHARAHAELWRPLTWEEVREMRAGGVGIGLHGHSHQDLGKLSPSAAAADLERGCALLKEHLGLPPECLALPYGGHESVPWAVLPRMGDLGISWVFTTIAGRARLPHPPPLLPRLLVLQQDTLADFRRKLTGAYDFLGPLQGWKYRVHRWLASTARREKREREG
jgi:peptidoglycan/xylan/chitin deacetylase (PgdA/CDA1 family)